MNYYERHLGDYARDTQHLSMMEHGAYGILLDRCYATEQGIPDGQAHRLARARTPAEKAAVDSVLAEFFRLIDGNWVNRRVIEEIEKANRRIDAAKENGKRGGRPKKEVLGSEIETQEKPTGFPLGSEIETQQKAPHIPDTIHHIPILKEKKDKKEKAASPGAIAPTIPEIPPELLADFLKIRQAKKAPLTKTAIDGIRREAQIAGLSMDEAIRACCEFGWQGFKADWYAERQKTSSKNQQTETLYQRTMRERAAEFAPDIARKNPNDNRPIESFFVIDAVAENPEKLRIAS